MIFFFDRCIGKNIPQALLRLKRFPVGIEYHDKHYPQRTADDEWMPKVAAAGWIVVSQDYRYHENPSELFAMHQHGLGAFYLWGAEATQWEKLRVFARAYDRIVEKAEATKPPFLFTVTKDAQVKTLTVPYTARLGSNESGGRRAGI